MPCKPFRIEEREEAAGLQAGSGVCQGPVVPQLLVGSVGSAWDHHLPGVVRKGPRPITFEDSGGQHMLRWGPRALDLDDCETPTSPELGLLDSGPKMGIQNSPFLSGGWRSREQHSPSQRNLSSATL